MKILHITEAYGGGVFTSVNQLVEGQCSAGHEVVLAVSPRPEAPSNWRDVLPASVRCHPLRLQRAISPLHDLRGIAQLVALIRRERPDAIHLHSSKAGFAGRVAAWLTGYANKTFYSPRAFAYLAPGLSAKKRMLYQCLEKVGALFGGLLVACSQDELDEARRLGVSSELVNNAIDQKKLTDLVAGVEKTESPVIRVFTSGRVCEAKRPELFVAVAEELRAKGLPVTFTWIGGGDAFPDTEAATCLGWVPRGEAVRLLKEQADIYLQTSSYEGMPLSVLEAQALGIPVVVADAVGNRSAVSNELSGFVVKPVTASALARCVERLVLDSALRQGMAQRAQDWARAEFDTPLMLRRYDALYKKQQ